MTNREQINQMDNSELAEFLAKITECGYGYFCEACPLLETKSCNKNGIKEWLDEKVDNEVNKK